MNLTLGTVFKCINTCHKDSKIQCAYFWKLSLLFISSFPTNGHAESTARFHTISCLALTNLMLNQDNHYDLNHSNAYFI